MKKLLLTLAILLTSTSMVLAQQIEPSTDETTNPQVPATSSEGQVTDTSSLFDVELQVGTQSAWNKEVPVYIKFRSNITADNVEISWDAPSGVKVTRKHPQFVSVVEGNTYTYKAVVKPLVEGNFNIAGNVTIWKYNTNYTSSGNLNITFGTDLLTQPLTAGYTGAVITRYLIIALLFILAGAGLFVGSKFGLKYLKEWLKPPE